MISPLALREQKSASRYATFNIRVAKASKPCTKVARIRKVTALKLRELVCRKNQRLVHAVSPEKAPSPQLSCAIADIITRPWQGNDARDATTNERAATLICHERREIESNDA